MPELPEVETICQSLRPLLEGESFIEITSFRPNLRLPLPKDFTSLLNQPLSAVSRRAKYMLWEFARGEVLILHLGMSGRILIDAPRQPHDHLCFITSKGQCLSFRDPRRFGLVVLTHQREITGHPLFSHLGQEPLSASVTAQWIWTKAQSTSTSLKSFLLNQKVMVGIGNIYAAEALYRAQLSPFRAAKTLSLEEAEALRESIQTVLQEAIAKGGTTLRDYAQPDGTLGYFQHHFAVYGREQERCKRCGSKGIIERQVQNGRSTFYCPRCQK